MPRKPVVSRTIDVVSVTAMVANEKEMKMYNKEYKLYKKRKSDKMYLLDCQENESSEDIKVLRILDKKIQRIACKQPIQKFINESEKTYLD